MANIEILLSRLEKVSAKGTAEWQACCPAHGDKSPSLSIRQTSDDRVLIHCFAGCSALDVLAAVGLDWASLFPAPLPRYASMLHKPVRKVTLGDVVIDIAKNDMAKGKPLSDRDQATYRKAIEQKARAERAVQ
jgi:hypothetical protein